MKNKSTTLLLIACAMTSTSALLYKNLGQLTDLETEESNHQRTSIARSENNSNEPSGKSNSGIELNNDEYNFNQHELLSKATESKNSNHTPEFDETNTGVNLESLAGLIAHINQESSRDFDFDKVVNLVNISDLSFDYISKKYLSTENTDKRRFLINVLNTTTNLARDSFAIELTLSSELDQRRLAYSWLNNHQSQSSANTDLINNTLLNATYHESDNETLSQLISAIPLSSFAPTSNIRKSAILRLNELAFHPDETVSSKATAKISRSEITQNTLNILQLHLQDSSESLQYVALEGLNNFEHPTDDILASLNAILHSPDLSQKNRAMAARVLIAFENRMYAHENL